MKGLKPARNSLAILYTCRQINAETRGAWLGHVTFWFEDAKTCMKKPSDLPQEVVSQMRHVCILNHLMTYTKIRHATNPRPAECLLPNILRLFPSIQLTRLIVLQGNCCSTSCLTSFIVSESGWKVFIMVHQDEGYKSRYELEELLEGLDRLQTMLRLRDGYRSGSTIEFYLAPAPNRHSIRNAAQDDYKPVTGELVKAFIATRNLRNMLLNTDLRAVVRRGKDVDCQRIADHFPPEYEPLEDIVDEKNRLGWDEFLDRCHIRCLDDCKNFQGDEHDDYVDVEDFQWHM